MVTKVISELKSVSRLEILPETGPWSHIIKVALKGIKVGGPLYFPV